MSQSLNSPVAVIGIDVGKNSFHIIGQIAAGRSRCDIDNAAQSSRLAEFGGRGISFNVCRGTFGSLAMFPAMKWPRKGRKRRGHPDSRPR